MTDTINDTSEKVATSDGFIDPLTRTDWVKFDDESTSKSPDVSEEINTKVNDSPAIIEIPSNQISQLSTIDLPTVTSRREQEGFGNLQIVLFAKNVYTSIKGASCVLFLNYMHFSK